MRLPSKPCARSFLALALFLALGASASASGGKRSSHREGERGRRSGVELHVALPSIHVGRHGHVGLALHAVRPARLASPRTVSPRHPTCREVFRHDVWVPARVERVWYPPLVERRTDLWGRPYEVVLAPGHWRTVHVPGHYETRTKGRYR